MSEEPKDISRRNFFGTLGKVIATGAVITSRIMNTPKIAKADGQYNWTTYQPKPYIYTRDLWSAEAPRDTMTARDIYSSHNLIFHHSGLGVFTSTDYNTCANKVYEIISFNNPSIPNTSL